MKTTVIRQGTPLPPRKATLDVSLKAVAELPEKAVYMAKESGLTLTLERKDSTLHIKAETDSIAPVVTKETQETVAWKTSESELAEKASDKVSWWKCIVLALVGAVAFGLITKLQKLR